MSKNKGESQRSIHDKDIANGTNSETTEIETTQENTVDVVQAEQTTASTETTELSAKELYLREQLALAKELNLSVRTDKNTGMPILPSTPAMRAAAARRAVSVVMPTVAMDIEQHIFDTYGKDSVKDVNIKLLIDVLSDYVKLMSPSASITETQGGNQQAKLANLYDVVLSLKPELSQISLEIIVNVIKQNIRGAFAERNALRFANTMPIDKERAMRFQLLTTLFISMAGGTAKKDLAKTINLKQLLEYVTERNAKANISEFIN